MVSLDFTDNGLWTPQTSMLRSIEEWIRSASFPCSLALSIDQNPTLDQLVQGKWPGIVIERAIYPASDAQNLSSLADNRFDLVYSHQVLEHLPKPWRAAREIVRVLKPGGLGLHTTCAYNPRHGPPAFNDYYRFLPDGLAELFENVEVLVKAGWGNRQALLYNLAIDDGHGALGGRRFHSALGQPNDENHPWVTWIIFRKINPSPCTRYEPESTHLQRRTTH
jgi:SAM-dependent methyltransferase